jgi:hypothetical protein
VDGRVRTHVLIQAVVNDPLQRHVLRAMQPARATARLPLEQLAHQERPIRPGMDLGMRCGRVTPFASTSNHKPLEGLDIMVVHTKDAAFILVYARRGFQLHKLSVQAGQCTCVDNHRCGTYHRRRHPRSTGWASWWAGPIGA